MQGTGTAAVLFGSTWHIPCELAHGVAQLFDLMAQEEWGRRDGCVFALDTAL